MTRKSRDCTKKTATPRRNFILTAVLMSLPEAHMQMNSVRITYDAEGDILYIAFGHSREATGYQLSDQILLRMDPEGDGPAGLTIFNFLHHVGSESGIRDWRSGRYGNEGSLVRADKTVP